MVAKATYRPVAKMHLPQTISSDFKKITYYEKSQGERLEVLVKQKSMLATKCTTCPILYQNRSNKTSPCLNKGVHFTSHHINSSYHFIEWRNGYQLPEQVN